MTILFKSCPRCRGGDMYREYEDLICFQCGFTQGTTKIIDPDKLFIKEGGYLHKVGFLPKRN